MENNMYNIINNETLMSVKLMLDNCAHFGLNNIPYWNARELQTVLQYKEWRTFEAVIQRAMVSCQSSGYIITDHFVAGHKMVSLGSGSIREVTDYMLSKFACKLICMNGDPNQKPIIGIAQSYFAIVTNNLEDMIDTYKYSERLEPVTEAKEQTKQFNSALYSHGVNTSKGIASIKSKGDEAFFGGYNTQDMKEKLGIQKSSSLNDCLDSLPLSFKNAAMQLSKRQIIDNNFRGENTITNLHMNNNSTMRDVMINNGYYPEDFPAEENFKKLEKRLGKIPDINPEELIILTNTITGEKVIIKNPFIKIK